MDEYLEGDNVTRSSWKPTDEAPVPLDATDKKILSILMKDGRASIADIARHTNVKRDTVVNRIHRFKQRQLLLSAHTILNPNALGHGVFLIVMIKIVPVPESEIEKFTDMLTDIANVTHVSHTMGRYDFIITIAAKSIQESNQVINEVKSLQQNFISDIEILNVITEPKIDDFTGIIEKI